LYAIAHALVLFGVLMMKPVRKIAWIEMDNAIPACIAMLLIPLTCSIIQGIIWGFLSWTFIKVINGKSEEVSPMLWGIDIFAVLALIA